MDKTRCSEQQLKKYKKIHDKVISFFPISANSYAVISGIKNLAKMHVHKENKEKFAKIFKLFDVHVSFGKGRGLLLPAYISKDKELAEYYSLNDPENKYEKQTEKEMLDFAKALGYPLCCINDQASLIKKNKEEAHEHLLKKLKGIKSCYCNWLLYPHNLSLSFHQPCSFGCEKTIKYNKEILAFIEKINQPFADKISGWLSKPILLWFDCSHGIRLFHDTRFQITFNNYFSAGTVKFSKCLQFGGNGTGKNLNMPSEKFRKTLLITKKLTLSKDSISIPNASQDIIEKRDKFSGILIEFGKDKNEN
ncbi:hypothetical protein JW707_05125 [Candidatus Woesearchaeota archaeon]|nr:hypothetical protein [Candidatus Woesearchaeota archaeon]